jgi:hypothetical protein
MGKTAKVPSNESLTSEQKRVSYYRSLRANSSINRFDRFSGNSIAGVTNVFRFRNYLYDHPFNSCDDNFIAVERMMNSFYEGHTDDWRSPFRFRIPIAVGMNCAPSQQDGVISEVITDLLSENQFYSSSPELVEFEDKQRKRYSTTSIQTPFMEKDGLLDSLLPYFESDSSCRVSFDESVLDEAFEILQKLIPLGSLEPDDVVSVADKSDKSSAYSAPYYKRGNQIDVVSGLAIWELHLMLAQGMISSNTITNYVAVMYCRVTPNGTDKPNQRTVWGISHAIVLVELTFFHPLLRELSNLEPFLEIKGSEYIDEAIDAQMKVDRLYEYIGVDFSGYDKSIIRKLINKLYEVFASWFTPEWSSLVCQLGVYMATSDIVSPIGVHTGRSKSIASGMGFTNLADSCIQYVLFQYSRIKLCQPQKSCFCVVNGDDGIWGIPGLTPSIFCKLIGEFNMKSQESKCSFSRTSVSFCQRLYIEGYVIDGYHRGIRSSHRAVASIIRYERKRNPKKWHKVHDSIRCVMQLENLRYSPIFESVVDLMIRADHIYGLGTKLSGGVQELFKMGGSVEEISHLLGNSSWERAKYNKLISNAHSMKVVNYIDDAHSFVGK